MKTAEAAHSPDVSVIIPFYNGEAHLQSSAQSILGQTHANLELILINDGSADGSPDIAQELAAADKRVRVISKVNEGVSSARNAGLDLARGRYVAFLDCDDRMEPDTLEELLSCARTTGADAILFEHKVIRENGKVRHPHYPELDGPLSSSDAVKCVITPVSRFVWNKFFERSLLQGLYFDPSIHFGEDTLFSVHALHRARKIRYLARPFYLYYQHAESVTHGRFNARTLTGVAAYRLQTAFCAEHYPEIEPLAHLYYKNLVLNVIQLIRRDGQAEFAQTARELVGTYREGLLPHLLKAAAPFRLKLKLAAGWVSPGLIRRR